MENKTEYRARKTVERIYVLDVEGASALVRAGSINDARRWIKRQVRQASPEDIERLSGLPVYRA